MNKLEPGTKLVVASHNAGKVWEIKQLITPYGLDAVSAGDLNLPEPEETETTFAGNAKLKAIAAARASGHPALADDSGLEVALLDGAPGIYSARWAGQSKDFQVAMKKVADEVGSRRGWDGSDGAPTKPAANFICVLCLAWPDGEAALFEGRVDGHIVWPARGGNGFGYDPMFVADGMTQTFGEIEPEAKHALSHRRRAFDAFEKQCLSGLDPRTSSDGASSASEPNSLAGLQAAAANLSTQAELAKFIANLRADFAANPSAWENSKLDSYLEGLQGWIKDADLEKDPKWRALAKALLAASRYE